MFGKSDFGTSAAAKPAQTADGTFNQAALRSGGLQSKKSYDNQSVNSGGRSGVGFNLGRKTPVGDVT